MSASPFRGLFASCILCLFVSASLCLCDSVSVCYPVASCLLGSRGPEPPYLGEFVQTHVILTILRVCRGGSVLQLLTPDPVNLLNPLMSQSEP